MNITKSQNEAMTSSPLPIVRSYAGGREVVTINLDIKKQQTASSSAERPMLEDNAATYQCTTLSLNHDGRLTATDVIKVIVQNDLFSFVDSAFLNRFAEIFSIPNYDTLAAILVSGKYTYPEELSCHRKALFGNKQPLEELHVYVEQCKQLASLCFEEKNDEAAETHD